MVQKSLREYEKRESELRSQLIRLADGMNSFGSGISVTKVVRMGNIDYKRIPYDVDIEKYRNESTEYWKISFDKNET